MIYRVVLNIALDDGFRDALELETSVASLALRRYQQALLEYADDPNVIVRMEPPASVPVTPQCGECETDPLWQGTCRRCYYRAYRAQNRESIRASQRRYEAKQKESRT